MLNYFLIRNICKLSMCRKLTKSDTFMVKFLGFSSPHTKYFPAQKHQLNTHGKSNQAPAAALVTVFFVVTERLRRSDNMSKILSCAYLCLLRNNNIAWLLIRIQSHKSII